MRGLSPVSHNLSPADHLTDRPESQNLSGRHAVESQLLPVAVANAGYDLLRVGEVDVLEGGGVAEGVEQRLEVRLECREASIY